jgi:hypothetical protein
VSSGGSGYAMICVDLRLASTRIPGSYRPLYNCEAPHTKANELQTKPVPYRVMWLHGSNWFGEHLYTMPLFRKSTNFFISQCSLLVYETISKHLNGVVTTPRFSKPFSKHSRKLSHPRVFGSTTSVSQRRRC